MSEISASLRNNKRRRALFISASLLAMLAVCGLGLGVFAKISDVADRAH